MSILKMGNDLCAEITLTNNTPISLQKAIDNWIAAVNAALTITIGYEGSNSARELWLNNSGNGNIRMMNNIKPSTTDPEATQIDSTTMASYGYKLANGPNGKFSNVNIEDMILMANGADAVLDVWLVF